ESVGTGSDWSGQAIIGIRPESIRLVSSGIPATVKWVEHLGAHYLIGVQAGEVGLTLTNSHRPESDTVQIQIKSEDIHVFERSSGANLCLDRSRTVVRLQH